MFEMMKIRNEMDLEQVPLLRRNKPVVLNTATPGELVNINAGKNIHLIAEKTRKQL